LVIRFSILFYTTNDAAWSPASPIRIRSSRPPTLTEGRRPLVRYAPGEESGAPYPQYFTQHSLTLSPLPPPPSASHPTLSHLDKLEHLIYNHTARTLTTCPGYSSCPGSALAIRFDSFHRGDPGQSSPLRRGNTLSFQNFFFENEYRSPPAFAPPTPNISPSTR